MNSATETLPPIVLKPREDQRLLQGHLWVFSNEIGSASRHIEPGSLCLVRNASGDALGVGFYNPRSLIAVRMLALGETALPEDFFKEKVSRTLDYRRQLYPQENSFRLCFGESDGLPGLIVDKYEDILVGQVLSAGIEGHWDKIQQALVEQLSPSGILLKNDHELRRLEGLAQEIRVAYGQVPERVKIKEGDLEFWVALRQAQKTGFYFDQRESRFFLRPFFKNRKVLDLYCYTGAFALHAAKSGAAQVWAVDSSPGAIELAQANAEVNGLAETVTFKAEDAPGLLETFAQGELPVQPDFVLLDPPNLVPSRKDLQKAARLYVKLNAMALKGLPAGGYLATSSCAHHVSREFFSEILRQAAAKARRKVRILAWRGQAMDHPVLLSMPETEYLQFALLQVIY